MQLQYVIPQQIIQFDGKVKHWIFQCFNPRTKRYVLNLKDNPKEIIYVKNGTTEVTIIY
jgi:hypothetical protein